METDDRVNIDAEDGLPQEVHLTEDERKEWTRQFNAALDVMASRRYDDGS